MVFDAGAIEARLILDRSQFQRDLAAARQEASAFEKESFNARIGIDNRQALNAIQQVQAEWDALRTSFGKGLKFDVDNSEANNKISETELLFEQLRETLQQNIELKPNIDLTNLQQFSQQAHTQFLGEEITIDFTTPGAAQAQDNINGVTKAINESAAASQYWHGYFGLLMKDITLWGGLFGSLHLIGSIQAWHILLDGVIETMAVVSEGGVALGETAVAAAPGIEDIYTRFKALLDVSNSLNQDLPPLTGHLQEVGQRFASLDLEAFGAGVNLLNQSGGVWEQTATRVGVGIDDVLAKLDLWNAAQQHTGKLSQDGAVILQQLATVAGNLFLAFQNLIKADPGTVHFLLDVLEGASKVLEIVSEIPQPLLFSALAIHSFLIWGGLLTTGLSKLVPGFVLTGLKDLATSITGIGKATEEASAASAIPLGDLRKNVSGVEQDGTLLSKTMAGLTGILASPAAWVVGAAAAAYLGYQMTQADAAAKGLVATLTSQVNNAPASQAINDINNAIGQLNQQVKNFPIAENDKIASSVNNAFGAAGRALHDTVNTNKSFWDQVVAVGKVGADSLAGIGDQVAGIYHTIQIGPTESLFKGTIVDLTKEQDNLFRELGVLTRGTDTYSVSTLHLAGTIGKLGPQVTEVTHAGYSYVQALQLMDLAGIRANDSFGLMQQKIKNLITGWQDMSVSGNILRNGMGAITLASEIQQSKISQLTGGWDAFMKLVSGGETGFIGFQQSLTSVATAAQGLNVAISAGSATTVHQTASMTGLNQASLALRSSWQSSLSAAGQYYDSLAQMASAAGLGKHGTDLLTQAGKYLIAELLPQAKSSQAAADQLYAFAQIAGYTGPNSLSKLTAWLGNTHGAATKLDKITTTLTTDSANLLKDVENLAAALNQQLNQAMSAAIFQATGGQKAFDNFATAVLNSHGNLKLMHSSAQALASQLISVLGNTSQAKNEFFAFAQQLGLTRKQAQQLWNTINDQPTRKQETIVVHGDGSFTAGQGLRGMAEGGRIPGYGGGDRRLILAEDGETVVSKESSSLPFMQQAFKAANVPGYAQGGIVGYHDGLPGLGKWYLGMEQQVNSAFEQQLADAISKELKQMSSGGFSGGPLSGNAGIAQNWAKAHMGAWGWPPNLYWPALDALWTKESGWNAYAVNPSSGAYGIPQSLGHGHPYNLGDYIAQILWGFNYIQGTYGNPINAENHESAFNWYDTGGPVRPGVQLIGNGTGRDEYMLNPDASSALLDAIRTGTLSGSNIDAVVSRLDHLIRVVSSVPAATAGGVAHAVNARQGTQVQAARLGLGR